MEWGLLSTAEGDEGDVDKENMIESLVKGNEYLRRENLLLETYVERVNPVGPSTEDEEDVKARKKGGGRKARAGPEDGIGRRLERRLTVDEKYDIACAEMDLQREEGERMRATSEHALDDLRALMEETEMRGAETKKEAYEFKRDIVLGGENARTGKTMAEKIQRYAEEKARSKDAAVEKLRLKNSTLKSQIQKVQQLLQQKEQMGEVLHAVDFDQLKIQNQQFLETIEERNNELLRLKLTTGKTVQVLNSLKKRLSSLTWQSDWLQKAITERNEQLAKFNDDILRITEEKKEAERVNRMLVQEQEDTELPYVMDYIKLKAHVLDLERKAQDWERKVEIAEMECKRLRKHYGGSMHGSKASVVLSSSHSK